MRSGLKHAETKRHPQAGGVLGSAVSKEFHSYPQTGSYGHALRCGFSGLSKGGVSQPLRPCPACVETGLDSRRETKRSKKVPALHLFPRSSSELEGLVLASLCVMLLQHLHCNTKDNDQEFEEIYNLAMSLTVENDHATVVRATSLKF